MSTLTQAVVSPFGFQVVPNGATTPKFNVDRYGNVYFAGTFAIDGAVSFAGALAITGAVTMASTLAVTGAATFASTVGITGATTVGALNAAVTAIAFADSPYTVAAGVYTLLCDATSGAIAITLPAASAGKRILNIKKTDSSANAVTVTRAGSDTIDGLTTAVAATQYQSFTIQSDGTSAWSIL